MASCTTIDPSSTFVTTRWPSRATTRVALRKNLRRSTWGVPSGTPVRASKRCTATPERSASVANSVWPSVEKRRSKASADVCGRTTSSHVRVSRTIGCGPPSARREPLRSNSTLEGKPAPGITRDCSALRRVAVSNRTRFPSVSLTVNRRSSGLSARPVTRPPMGRTPIAAGLLSSAPSRFPRVWTESSSATPWRASNSERSISSVASACAPSRCAAAASAWARAGRADRGRSRRRRPRAAAERSCLRSRRAGGAGRGRSRAGRRPGRRARWRRARRRGRPPTPARRPAARRGTGCRDRERRRPTPERPHRAGDGGGGRWRPPRASPAAAAIRAGAPRAPPRPCRRRRSAAGAP